MKTGIELIQEERLRQIEDEGFTSEHDALHKEDELARAAACYATPSSLRWVFFYKIWGNLCSHLWPWDLRWWKPTPEDRIKELKKAGALIIAELDNRLKNKQQKRPKVVCLCGSTRFYKEFQKANYEETMKGNIVLSVGFYPHASEEMHGEKIGITPEQKTALDELHKRKIDLADEIFVINVQGYIGESTRSEIDYAFRNNKTVRYYEPVWTLKPFSMDKALDVARNIPEHVYLTTEINPKTFLIKGEFSNGIDRIIK